MVLVAFHELIGSSKIYKKAFISTNSNCLLQISDFCCTFAKIEVEENHIHPQ